MDVILREVLAAFSLLTTAKVAVDVASSDPDSVGDAAAILALGSILAAVLIISPWPPH